MKTWQVRYAEMINALTLSDDPAAAARMKAAKEAFQTVRAPIEQKVTAADLVPVDFGGAVFFKVKRKGAGPSYLFVPIDG